MKTQHCEGKIIKCQVAIIYAIIKSCVVNEKAQFIILDSIHKMLNRTTLGRLALIGTFSILDILNCPPLHRQHEI